MIVRKGVTIWVTEYALGSGVFKVRADIHSDGSADTSRLSGLLYCGKKWHLTEKESAVAVLGMVHRKRRSLTKQMKKLESIEETVLKVLDVVDPGNGSAD